MSALQGGVSGRSPSLWAQFRDQPNFQMVSVSCENEPTSLGKLRVETIMFLVKKDSKLPTYADEGFETRRNVAMVLGAKIIGFGFIPRRSCSINPEPSEESGSASHPEVGDQIKHLVEELLKQ